VWKDGKHACKKVCYDDYVDKHGISTSHEYSYDYDRILWEQDYYYTGRTYPSFDTDAGTSWEKLAILYDYRTRRFTVHVTTDDQKVLALANMLGFHGGMGATNQETLEVADKILKKWGKSRL
jgi:hypothetical protein